MKYIISYSFLVLLFLSNCNKDADIDVDFGYDYFPMEVGVWQVYEVDSIVYDDNESPPNIDTFHYDMKVVVAEAYTDNAGQDARIIKRYTRASDTLLWELKSNWSAVLQNSRVEQVEGNQRYIKMIFPITDGESWDGNSFNALGDETYSYSEVDEGAIIGEFYFDSTLVVTEIDNQNKIEIQYTTVTYAKGIGAVYKKIVDLETEFNGMIIGGLDLTMTIKSAGN
ncbi:MAG: hypothetical protein HRT71_12960 [Flavobacteriales bacterium]|nr:hypothetical protein [Flavobacteriales bacterium]